MYSLYTLPRTSASSHPLHMIYPPSCRARQGTKILLQLWILGRNTLKKTSDKLLLCRLILLGGSIIFYSVSHFTLILLQGFIIVWHYTTLRQKHQPFFPCVIVEQNYQCNHSTMLVPAGSYVFCSTAQGDWFFHCHIQEHLLESLTRIVAVDPKGQKPPPEGFNTWYFCLNSREI